MGCMRVPGKGLSQLVLPYHGSISSRQKLTSDNVKEQIDIQAKKGLASSQIGVISGTHRVWHRFCDW